MALSDALVAICIVVLVLLAICLGIALVLFCKHPPQFAVNLPFARRRQGLWMMRPLGSTDLSADAAPPVAVALGPGVRGRLGGIASGSAAANGLPANVASTDNQVLTGASNSAPGSFVELSLPPLPTRLV